MLPVVLNVTPVGLVPELIAKRARERRLAFNLSRKSLAEKSGVPESTIKRFEVTGNIALAQLASIAMALDCLSEMEALFPPKAMLSLEDIGAQKRQRGRR